MSSTFFIHALNFDRHAYDFLCEAGYKNKCTIWLELESNWIELNSAKKMLIKLILKKVASHRIVRRIAMTLIKILKIVYKIPMKSQNFFVTFE